MKTKTVLFVISIIIFSYLTFLPTPSHASVLDNLIDGVKNLFTNKSEKLPDKNLTIDSSIILAPNGDMNNNGQIDAGDTITFSYNIKNNTDKKYVYATLKTNVNRDSLNYINNVSGVTGLNDDGKSIDFPNLRVEPGMVKVISFDARINYFTEQDPVITTEPEMVSEQRESILKSLKKEVQAKRIKKEDIPHFTRILK